MTIQDTSLAAFDSMKPRVATDQERVADLVRRAGPNGCTDEEIERALGMRHQSSSARRNELMNMGRLVDSTKRRMTSSGRAAIVWVVPANERNDDAEPGKPTP